MPVKRVAAPVAHRKSQDNLIYNVSECKMNKRLLKEHHKSSQNSSHQEIKDQSRKKSLERDRKRKMVHFNSVDELISLSDNKDHTKRHLSHEKRNSKKRGAKGTIYFPNYSLDLIESYFNSPIPTILKNGQSSFSRRTSVTNSLRSSCSRFNQEESTASSVSDFFRETSQRSFNSLESGFFTKPFSSLLQKEISLVQQSTNQIECPKNKKQDKKTKILELEDERSGEMVKFNLYNDKDLPFLDPTKKKNQVIRANIIDGGQDDDCLTDNEQQKEAIEMIEDELEKAVGMYLKEKKDGQLDGYVKNMKAYQRFSRPF